MARVKAKAEPATLAQAMSADGDRRAAMQSVASRFSGSSPAYEIFQKVRAVPTCFPFLDLQTKVGGWPIERPTLIHGPSNHGKTLLCLGIGKSFLDRDHFFLLIDAEYSTEKRWLKMLGIPKHPGFRGKKPRSYEDAVESVYEFCTKIAEARIAGDLPPDMSGIVVVDSINQLAPKDLMKELFSEAKGDDADRVGKKGIDGAGGRSGQILAKINNAWMKILVPLMGTTGMGIVIIAREIENQDKSKYVEDFLVTGGKGINFDSSLSARVVRAGYVSQGDGENKEIYGERHKVIVRKTKVGRKENKRPEAYFNSSYGTLKGVPAGLDPARDYLETAIEIGRVEKKGNFYHFDHVKLGQGEHNVVKRLYAEPALYESLRLAVRDGIDRIIKLEPGESDE